MFIIFQFYQCTVSRPNDLLNATNNNNNSIRKETKLVLIDHDQSVLQSNDYSDDDSFDSSSLGSK